MNASKLALATLTIVGGTAIVVVATYTGKLTRRPAPESSATQPIIFSDATLVSSMADAGADSSTTDAVSLETLAQTTGFGPLEKSVSGETTCWMTQSNSQFEVVAAPADRQHVLHLSMRTLAPRQEVRVYVNEQVVGTLQPNEQRLRWESPPLLLNPGRNQIRFRAKNFSRQDSRRLYIALDEFRLDSISTVAEGVAQARR